MSIPNANRLSVVFLPKHQQIADDFIFEARNRYPELNIESISLTGQQADVPTGTAVAQARSLFLTGGWPVWPPTARVERAHSYRARSASTGDQRSPPILLIPHCPQGEQPDCPSLRALRAHVATGICTGTAG